MNIVLLFLCLARIRKRAVLCQIDLNNPLLRPLVDDSRWLRLLESIGKSPVEYGDQGLLSALCDVPVDELPWKPYSVWLTPAAGL